jgi:hypothetical protein
LEIEIKKKIQFSKKTKKSKEWEIKLT